LFSWHNLIPAAIYLKEAFPVEEFGLPQGTSSMSRQVRVNTYMALLERGSPGIHDLMGISIPSTLDALLSMFMSPMTTAGGDSNHLGLVANAFMMISGPIPAGQPMEMPNGFCDCNLRVCACICGFISDHLPLPLVWESETKQCHRTPFF